LRKHDVVDSRGINLGAFHQRAKNDRTQLSGRNRGQCTQIFADGRADW